MGVRENTRRSSQDRLIRKRSWIEKNIGVSVWIEKTWNHIGPPSLNNLFGPFRINGWRAHVANEWATDGHIARQNFAGIDIEDLSTSDEKIWCGQTIHLAKFVFPYVPQSPVILCQE